MGQSKAWIGLSISSIVSLTVILGMVQFKRVVGEDANAATGGKKAVTTAEPAKKIDFTTDDKGLSKAVVLIETTRGKIRYKFYTKDAPKTVERIAELIQQKFYDGLTFHRVVKGFVVQGGDPSGTGSGGTGKKLVGEFNSRKHVAGAVAMARAQDKNSADCQFYITLGTHTHLDNEYTIFGQVIEGMDVAQQIQQGDRMVKVSIE